MWWVRMTDIEDWQKHYVVVECDDFRQASLIVRKAHESGVMKYISICPQRPIKKPHVKYTYRRFHQMGLWKRED